LADFVANVAVIRTKIRQRNGGGKSKPAPFDKPSPKGMRHPRTSQCVKDVPPRQGAESAIDFPAVADAENQNEEPVVFDLADQPIVADAVFPELAKS